MIFSNYRRTQGGIANARVWEVARATSAHPAFFDPITIGSYGTEFSGGLATTNNPINLAWSEAEQQWGAPLARKLNCVVSIGTGLVAITPSRLSNEETMEALQTVSHDARRSARSFQQSHRDFIQQSTRYFRFEVTEGTRRVGFAEDKAKAFSATNDYFEDDEVGEKAELLHKLLQDTAKSMWDVKIWRHKFEQGESELIYWI